MNQPETNLDARSRTYAGLAFGIVSVIVAGSLLLAVISPGQFREEGRIFFVVFTVVVVILVTLSAGLGVKSYRTASGISAVLLGVGAFALIAFSLAQLGAKQATATDNSSSYTQGGTIFATGDMWLPILDRQSQSFAFHPAVPYREVTIYFDATGVELHAKFKNGILDTTMKRPGAPRSSERRLSFVPSSTEEHTIEVVRIGDATDSYIRYIRIEQQ